jgi:tRNA (Thr-GGU) A37 N-methylase
MSRFAITCTLIAILFAASLYAEESTIAVFKMHPIGRVEKSEDRTLIVLDEKYQPGLLGLQGFTHIYVFWWFDKNDSPEKRMRCGLSSVMGRLYVWLQHPVFGSKSVCQKSLP